MRKIMTNMGIEKTRYSVIGNIVHIVPLEEKWGPNQLNINHLGEKQ